MSAHRKTPGMRQRHGFTLVELLVAMALVVFLMVVLAEAFAAAAKSFRDLKAAGDLAEKLRSVSGQLRRDLAADHFEGKKRLSDPTFWADGPPRQGFFRLYQGSRPAGPGTGGPCVLEGVDGDGLRSYRSADHILHFTVKLRGNREADFFSAGVPPGSPLLTAAFGPVEARYQGAGGYRFQWAEVAYFLRPSPDTAEGTPLYTLHRRQRLAVPGNGLVPRQPATLAARYLEVSCDPDPADSASLFFNSPLDLTVPPRRFGTRADGLPRVPVAGHGLTYPTLAEQTTDGDLHGADVALTDVLSFDVRLLPATAKNGYAGPADPRNPFVDLFDPSLAGYDNGNAALFAADGPRVFDTWASGLSSIPSLDFSKWDVAGGPRSIPMWKAAAPSNIQRGVVVRAVQITIRAWDARTSLTREVTVIQEL